MVRMSVEQDIINQLVPVRQLLVEGRVIEADRKLDKIIEELHNVVKKPNT